jgi:hypothetical protein
MELVRLNAIRSLKKLASSGYLALDNAQLQTAIMPLHEANVSMREAAYQMLRYAAC